MKYFLILLYMGMAVNVAKAQLQVQTVRDKYACRNVDNYIPAEKNFTPLKRLRLVIHVFAKADGSGNFRNYSRHKDFIKQIFTHAEWHYADIEKLTAPKIHEKYYYLPDSRIRFVVDTIVFHYDDDAWDFEKYVMQWNAKQNKTEYDNYSGQQRAEELWRKFVNESTLLNSRQKDSALNIFLLEAPGQEGKGMAENMFSKKWVYGIGSYARFAKDSSNPNHWDPGNLFAHEIGHALGLYHPYDFQYCTDMYYAEKGKTNNIMDSYPGSGRALTPYQMGIIHRGLQGLGGAAGTIQHILINDNCFYHEDATVYISAGDTIYWRGEKQLWGDIHIQNGAVLVVECKMSLPSGAGIYVFNGGTLIINGGELTNACGKNWLGIKKQKNIGLLRRKSKAVVQLKNGATITNTATPVEETFF